MEDSGDEIFITQNSFRVTSDETIADFNLFNSSDDNNNLINDQCNKSDSSDDEFFKTLDMTQFGNIDTSNIQLPDVDSIEVLPLSGNGYQKAGIISESDKNVAFQFEYEDITDDENDEDRFDFVTEVEAESNAKKR